LLQKIELNRFPKDEMVAVLNAHFENVELSDTLFDRLYKETEGNPLFTLEVFKMLVDENIIEYDATTAVYRARAGMNIEKIKIPDKIHDVITRRLNRLEKEYRKLLDPAAVEGEYFHAETLEKILGMNRLKLLDALNTIERIHKLIRSLEDKFRFDHVKIREVIYNELNPLLRKEYHKLVGQCIEEQNRTNLSAVVVELATHYYLAEEIDKAIPYLMQAGKKAKDDFASKEAVRFYQNALEFLDRKSAAPPALDITVQKLECLEALGDIYSLAGEYDVSFSYYSVALTSANALGDKLKISDINRKIGAIYEKIGRYEKSLQYYDTALAAARATAQKGAPEPIEVARVYNEIGWTYHRKSEYDKAIEHCQKGLKLAQLHDDEKEIAVSFHMIGSNYLRKGDYNLALEFLNKGLEIRKRISDMRGISTSYNNIGVAYLRKGELDRAVEYYMKDLKISEKIGDRRGIAVSYNNIGIVYLRKGELDRGLEYYTKSLEILKKIGDLRGIAASCNNIGAVYHDKGELDCALDYYTKSLEIREKIGDMRGIAMSYNNIGAVYMERDSTGSWVAAGWFEKARNLREKIGDKSGFCESYSGLCESHARAGEINKAVEYGRKALELAREIGAKDSIAVSNKVLGIAYREMRDWSNAEKHFEESVRFYREIGQEVELAKCWYEYALMFKRRTAGADAENAEKYLQMALEMFEKRKMMGWVEKVKKAFG
jgi:tetratricopeptide (TPR) repeat protein